MPPGNTHSEAVHPALVTLLRRAYAAFNARDMDAVLATLHQEVDWPNGTEGGYVKGHEAVRNYWTRQWTQINPVVEPQDFTSEKPGQVAVQVHQVIRDLTGNLLVDSRVQHVYAFEDGLIRRMDIRHE